ncbi:MAG: peptidoglycan recognition family protein, partial [Eggerthellaceae bacterium]|nr:peptidoglycan recognition family protein [Eggerthellaceae bacterium]
MRIPTFALAAVLVLAACLALSACSGGEETDNASRQSEATAFGSDAISDTLRADEQSDTGEDATASETPAESAAAAASSAAELRAQLNLTEDYRASLSHGSKGGEFQKYIVLHDTEGNMSPQETVNWWDGNGNLVAAHFVVGKDGSIVQCVPLDEIAHHAGFGDTGHNASFGVDDESRDDKLGTTPIGSWAADYGMNSYSVGIEIVHVGGEGDYPAAQLEALDALIAYI